MIPICLIRSNWVQLGYKSELARICSQSTVLFSIYIMVVGGAVRGGWRVVGQEVGLDFVI